MIHPSVNSPLNIDEEESFLLKEEDEASSEEVLPQIMHLKRSQWWIFVFISIFFLISAQAVAVLLGRFYYDQGGNSKWISTLVQTVGFPILYLPLCLLPASPRTSYCSFKTLVWIYLSLGLAIGLDNLLYSYGLLLLSASAYSLICGTQLIFNAVFSYLINSEKITFWTVMSIFFLTVSALVIALDDDSNSPSGGSKWIYVIGCLLTLLASLIYSLQLSLMQFSFEKIIKKETFAMVLEMQIYTSLVASCVSVIGLFASGEWKMLRMEMEEFHKGHVSYVLTLVGTSVSWQLGSVSAVALIFLVSSLFSNLIGTLSLIVTPLAALVVFDDKLTVAKIAAIIFAIPGVAFYMYKNYLDGLIVERARESLAD
ncbi:PREDICTED: probable purine permease 13 [Brassica oleracea var. oleracea]|uniref:Probable purine permease n=1 Tax=Brassica oleracea var. oleracea TaxID=109376 RepID=A0A0D3E8L1_BRAOL|nr:PREDICTED: probable purine permease 13 [Brassica oleracea var. oleracea]